MKLVLLSSYRAGCAGMVRPYANNAPKQPQTVDRISRRPVFFSYPLRRLLAAGAPTCRANSAGVLAAVADTLTSTNFDNQPNAEKREALPDLIYILYYMTPSTPFTTDPHSYAATGLLRAQHLRLVLTVDFAQRTLAGTAT